MKSINSIIIGKVTQLMEVSDVQEMSTDYAGERDLVCGWYDFEGIDIPLSDANA